MKVEMDMVMSSSTPDVEVRHHLFKDVKVQGSKTELMLRVESGVRTFTNFKVTLCFDKLGYLTEHKIEKRNTFTL